MRALTLSIRSACRVHLHPIQPSCLARPGTYEARKKELKARRSRQQMTADKGTFTLNSAGWGDGLIWPPGNIHPTSLSICLYQHLASEGVENPNPRWGKEDVAISTRQFLRMEIPQPAPARGRRSRHCVELLQTGIWTPHICHRLESLLVKAISRTPVSLHFINLNVAPLRTPGR